jgi:hypothetical protein
MGNVNSDTTESYDTYLRRERHGATPEARLAAASSILEEKLGAIEKAKKRQLNWVIAGYGFGAVMSFVYWGGTSGDGLAVAMFMNLAAYNYGKYKFQPEAEHYAFNQAVARWTGEGRPIGYD